MNEWLFEWLDRKKKNKINKRNQTNKRQQTELEEERWEIETETH